MLTAAWTPLRPHPVQRRLWTTRARFAIVPAGRGSGKTELAKRRLVRFLPVKKPWPNPQYFFAAPTRDQGKRIAWRDLKNLVPSGWIKGTPSESEMRIETVFGSSLTVIGMDKPQRAEGVQWDGGVIDESSDQRPGVVDLNIGPALTHRNAWLWRIGVPKRTGIGAAEYRKTYERACKGELAETEAFTWPSSDILTPEQLAWAMENMDPKDFNEQYNAKFETAGGGIFYAFDREKNVRPCPYRPELPLVVGSDFNVDPMAWVVGHDVEGRMEWIDEVWKRDTNTQECLDLLYERYRDHPGGFEFYGDASGRARKTSASKSDYIQILDHEGFIKLGRTVHYMSGNPPVSERFAACNRMFCAASGRRRMFVDPACEHLIDDLEARSYKPGTTEPADKGDVGHITDAMGYAVYALHPMVVENIDTSDEIIVIRR